MKEQNITINELSDSTGISIPTLKRLRTVDGANPTLDNLIKLSQYFGLSIDELTNTQENVPQESIKIPSVDYEDLFKFISDSSFQAKTIAVEENIKGANFCFIINKPLFSFYEDCIFYCSKDFTLKDGDFFISNKGDLFKLILSGDIMIALYSNQNSGVITKTEIYAKVIKVKYERNYG